MKQYLDLLQKVRTEGVFKGDRTGTGTYSIFGAQMRFDISGYKLPVVTTKYVHLKSVLVELLWLLKGTSEVDYMVQNDVRIWNEWIKKNTAIKQQLSLSERVSKLKEEFVEEYNKYDQSMFSMTEVEGWEWLPIRKLWRNPNIAEHLGKWLDDKGVPRVRLIGGDLGPVYGVQWRDWPVRTAVRIITMRNAIRILSANYTDEQVSERLANQGLENYIAFKMGLNADSLDELMLSNEEIDGSNDSTFKIHQVMLDMVTEAGFSIYNEVTTEGIDQIQQVISTLRSNSDDRRMLVSAWNPALVDEMALPPCHTMFQFYARPLSRIERNKALFSKGKIRAFLSHLPMTEALDMGDDEALTAYIDSFNDESYDEAYIKTGLPMRGLSCQLYQRSADIFLGVPFNIASYALLTKMIALVVNMEPLEFVWTGGDVHLYSNHLEQADIQLTREPKGITAVDIKHRDNIDAYVYEDFDFFEYNHHPAIKAPVAV